jgi:hypothetical protein
MIVDVTVANCSIRAEKPAQEYQNMPMPTNEVEKIIWFESAGLPSDRLNKRQFGYLKGKALTKAQKIVNENGGINTSGEYGSISISALSEREKQNYEKMIMDVPQAEIDWLIGILLYSRAKR